MISIEPPNGNWFFPENVTASLETIPEVIGTWTRPVCGWVTTRVPVSASPFWFGFCGRASIGLWWEVAVVAFFNSKKVPVATLNQFSMPRLLIFVRAHRLVNGGYATPFCAV